MANEILFPQGDDATLSLEINDSAGADLNLTGATVTFHVYNASGTEEFNKTASIDDAAQGLASVVIAAADTSTLNGIYMYKIKVVDNSGNISTVRTAEFYVLTVQNQINLNTVRTMIGDFDSTNYELSDAQLYFYVLNNSNVYSAAAKASRALQAQYAKLAVDTTIEDVSVKYSTRSEAYKKLAENLETTATVEDIPTPSVMGVSKEAVDAQREDDDRIQNKFYMDRFSNPPGNHNDDYYGEDT